MEEDERILKANEKWRKDEWIQYNERMSKKNASSTYKHLWMKRRKVQGNVHEIEKCRSK